MTQDDQDNKAAPRTSIGIITRWILVLLVAFIADIFFSPLRLGIPNLFFTSVALGGLLILSSLSDVRQKRLMLIGGIGIILVGGIIGVRAKMAVDYRPNPEPSCMKNLAHLSYAMIMYSQDNDSFLPPANRWVEAIAPYIENPRMFRCPQDTSGVRTSYAMNAKMSGKRLDFEDSERAMNTVLLFEVPLGGDNPVGSEQDFGAIGRHPDKLFFGTISGRIRRCDTPAPEVKPNWEP